MCQINFYWLEVTQLEVIWTSGTDGLWPSHLLITWQPNSTLCVCLLTTLVTEWGHPVSIYPEVESDCYFCIWVILLNIMFERFMHTVACVLEWPRLSWHVYGTYPYPWMITACFYLLATVNKVVHTGEQTPDILLSILLSIYPEVGLLEHMVISLLTWSNIRLQSWIITCFHDNNVQGYRFLHILINIYFLLKKKKRKGRKRKGNTSHLSECEVVSYCGFDLCFPGLNWDSKLEIGLAQVEKFVCGERGKG